MFKKIVIASALALMASASFAQTTPSVYAGVDVGHVEVDYLTDKKTAAGVFAGYNFNQTFSLEGGYRKVTIQGYKIQQTSLSALASMPFGNGFNVYGRLGYNDINVKGPFVVEDFDSGALYGVGVGYAFTPTISGRVEYQRPNSDSNILTAGVAFKF